MYLSRETPEEETLEDVTVSCPLWKYTVGYLQCFVLSTRHNVDPVAEKSQRGFIQLGLTWVGTPVKAFLSWVNWGGKIRPEGGCHRVKGRVSTECRECAHHYSLLSTPIHCSPLAFACGCKMARVLKLLMPLWTVNLELWAGTDPFSSKSLLYLLYVLQGTLP